MAFKLRRVLSGGERKQNLDLVGSLRRKRMSGECGLLNWKRQGNLAPENNLFYFVSFCCFLNSGILGFSLLLWGRGRKYKLTGIKQEIAYLYGRKTRKITFNLFFLL